MNLDGARGCAEFEGDLLALFARDHALIDLPFAIGEQRDTVCDVLLRHVRQCRFGRARERAPHSR